VSPVRVSVVGGGVIGLLTAMECARLGARVSVVERCDLPSPGATSNDLHRVVRALHRGDAMSTRAAARAHDAWVEVEQRLGVRFYHRVGALTAVPIEDADAEVALLGDVGAPAHLLSPAELRARCPRIRFPAGVAGVVEPAAGVVLARRALTAMVRWLREHPAVGLHPRSRVVELDGGGVRLADGTVLVGDRVVIAAGPSSRDLLPAPAAAELMLYRQSVLSYEPTPSRRAWEGTPAIPAIGTPQGAWLTPPVAGTPVRLSASTACRPVAEMTDRTTPDCWRQFLVDQFAGLIADFDPAAVVGATDGYYLAAPDGGLRLGALRDAWVYAACGGMSFKIAPLVARALADRAIGRRPQPVGLAAIDHPEQFPTAGPGRPVGEGSPKVRTQ
jgi:sarcosine oxidase